MSVYPYRVKRIRTKESVLVDNERETLDEKQHRVVIWRVSDSEFRAVRYVGSEEERNKLASIDYGHDRTRITAIFADAVREVLLYGKGEELPWPEVTSPPAAMESADACAKQLEKQLDRATDPKKKSAATVVA